MNYINEQVDKINRLNHKKRWLCNIKAGVGFKMTILLMFLLYLTDSYGILYHDIFLDMTRKTSDILRLKTLNIILLFDILYNYLFYI